MTTTVDTLHPSVGADRRTLPARLEFERNCSRVTIDAAAGMARLCHASFTGRAPKLREQQRTITIEYPLVSPASWIQGKRRAASLTLAAERPWEVAFGGGIAHLRVHLTEAEIRSFEITGGVSDAKLHLPAPRGVVPVRIGGGAHKLEIVRPEGTAVRLRVSGGAHRLAFDEQRFGAVGGVVAVDTPAAADAADRYEIAIAGGVSHLTVCSQVPVGLVS